MKLQAKAGSQFAYLDDGDQGEGLAIFLSQSATDTTRWKLEVYAKLDNGAELLVGTFYTSPPIATLPVGSLTRLVAIAAVPGVAKWSVCARPAGGPVAAAQESADLTLTSSHAWPGPSGVVRAGERYAYTTDHGGGGGSSFTVLPGQRVISWTCQSDGGLAALQISGGLTAVIPIGAKLEGSPDGAAMPPGTVFAYTNAYFFCELAESA